MELKLRQDDVDYFINLGQELGVVDKNTIPSDDPGFYFENYNLQHRQKNQVKFLISETLIEIVKERLNSQVIE